MHERDQVVKLGAAIEAEANTLELSIQLDEERVVVAKDEVVDLRGTFQFGGMRVGWRVYPDKERYRKYRILNGDKKPNWWLHRFSLVEGDSECFDKFIQDFMSEDRLHDVVNYAICKYCDSMARTLK